MKFLKNSLLFLFILLFVASSLIFCHSKSKKRDLSTPLSRLVGHWKEASGYDYYFSPVDSLTMLGSFVIAFPNKEKWMKTLEELEANFIGSGEELKEFLKKGKKLMEKYAGAVLYRQYEVLSQQLDGTKIEIKIFWNDDDPIHIRRVNYYIDKDGNQMIKETVIPYVGEVKNPHPIKYIDFKTSPEEKNRFYDKELYSGHRKNLFC